MAEKKSRSKIFNEEVRKSLICLFHAPVLFFVIWSTAHSIKCYWCFFHIICFYKANGTWSLEMIHFDFLFGDLLSRTRMSQFLMFLKVAHMCWRLVPHKYFFYTSWKINLHIRSHFLNLNIYKSISSIQFRIVLENDVSFKATMITQRKSFKIYFRTQLLTRENCSLNSSKF